MILAVQVALDSLFSLFFELSNEDRFGILEQLNGKTMNITNLSKRLNLSLQETSRHVRRLHKIDLIQKDKDVYYIAPYGKLVLEHLRLLQFLSKHKRYFNSHVLDHLPEEFLTRLSDLAECVYEDDSVLMWNNVQKVLKEAEENVWSLTHRYDVASAYAIPKALSRGVRMRNIDRIDAEEDAEMDPGSLAAMTPEDNRPIHEARKSGQLEERLLERVDTFLWVSEKEAVLAFPSDDGKFDYRGFLCKNEDSLKWCADLFQHYWERARPVKSVVDELHLWVTKRTETLNVFCKVAKEKRVTEGKELMQELEQKGLIAQGRLTYVGWRVYEKLPH
jgi:predicted transcriptional regulator